MPWGSVVVAWVAVLGAHRQSGETLAAALFAGIIRDVLLVTGLGVTSSILAGVWAVSAISMVRFDRPHIAAAIAAVAGAIGLALITGAEWFSLSLATGGLAIVFSLLWSAATISSGGIQLRR